jgi:hypothetical protein
VRSRLWQFGKLNITLAVLATAVWGVGLGALVAHNGDDAGAVKATDFQAGRIIDDAVFYNKDAMTVAEIEAVIRAHAPACDTWGTKTQTDSSAAEFRGWSRAKYAEYKVAQGSTFYHAPPYICIADYREDTATGKTTFDDVNWKGGKSVGQMIYDAAQKYGINPQVLIVTLRKESRLFADDWPVRNQYYYAMGYGCPDSGPGYSANCDPQYKGFALQIEASAWQLDKYRQNINSYNYRPGTTKNIQYAPEPSCGTKSVYIENLATASLYNYTPYTPNDAALKAYPGEASCGAYGNRNFFMYFNEWFGSTFGEPEYIAIMKEVERVGSTLGGSTSGIIKEPDGRVYQSYENGLVIWTKGSGARAVMTGPIRTRWGELGGSIGSLGVPVGEYTTTTDGRVYQLFQNGILIWTEQSGAWEVMTGVVRARWAELDGSVGMLGVPISSQLSTSDGRVYQNFMNGVILWKQETGAWEVMTGPIRTRWGELGGSIGSLGMPMGARVGYDDGRTAQQFQGGYIIWRDETGAWESVNGPIRTRWAQLGGSMGILGSPTGGIEATEDGRKFQYYQNGVIIWRDETGAWESVNGPIRTRWAQLGGSMGILGSPTGGIATTADGETSQDYQRGVIIVSKSGVRHEVR